MRKFCLAFFFFLIVFIAADSYAVKGCVGVVTSTGSSLSVDLSDTGSYDLAGNASCTDFQPHVVIVKHNSGSLAQMRGSGSGSTFELGGATTNTSCISSMDTTGFTIAASGTCGSINPGSGLIHYLALRDESDGLFVAGDYGFNASWTATDNLSLCIGNTGTCNCPSGTSCTQTSSGSSSFQPGMMLVKKRVSSVNPARFATNNTFAASTSAVANETDTLKSFISNGVTFGTNTAVQQADKSYLYFAFKCGAGYLCKVGTFSGTGSSQNINLGNIDPIFVAIKGNSTTSRWAFRFRSQTGSNSYVDNASQNTTCVTALSSGSMTVNTSTGCNENGVTMTWFAIGKDTTPASEDFTIWVQ